MHSTFHSCVLVLWVSGCCEYQGQVVRIIDSLTSSLMTNSFTVVAKVFSNTLIFCCKNMSSFCNAKAIHIFPKKKLVYLPYFKIEILTSR